MNRDHDRMDATNPSAVLLASNPFDVCRAQFMAACAALPDTPTPPSAVQLAEVKRLAVFRSVCDAEFLKRIHRAELPDTVAFDRVAQWPGPYPGRLATGATGAAKTRAAWSALGRLYVRENRPFKWYPVRALVKALDDEENAGFGADFFRHLGHYPILFIDDIDKINWQFDSTKQQLFAFYDWIYRTRKPCLTTTNKDRAWWANMMGEAFARRLFAEAHETVEFGGRPARSTTAMNSGDQLTAPQAHNLK